jgi:6-phosphogluconolactonase
VFRRSLMSAVVALLAIAAPAGAADDPGAVYALSNSISGNAVLVYDRSSDGSLDYAGSYTTGGAGTGGGLGSQGAVMLSQDGRILLAVNTGSNSVSSFAVKSDGLELRDVEGSGGLRPTSVFERHGLVYVLNAGVPNSIAGFRLDSQGELSPIAGSVRPLAAAQTTPSQIAIAPSGDALVVTERATNSIMTWSLGKNGVPGASHVFASGGAGPFGFDFGHRGTFVVSDAAGASGSVFVPVTSQACGSRTTARSRCSTRAASAQRSAAALSTRRCRTGHASCTCGTRHSRRSTPSGSAATAR